MHDTVLVVNSEELGRTSVDTAHEFPFARDSHSEMIIVDGRSRTVVLRHPIAGYSVATPRIIPGVGSTVCLTSASGIITMVDIPITGAAAAARPGPGVPVTAQQTALVPARAGLGLWDRFGGAAGHGVHRHGACDPPAVGAG